METQNTRPWRRYLHLSLRSLLVLVLAIGCWPGWLVHSARIQREAVAAIRAAGGRVAYDWQRRKNPRGIGDFVQRDKKPPYPEWLVRLLGDDYFGHVVWVYFGPRLSDSEMVHTGKLS